jgi:alpha-mannosidase
VQRFRYAVVPFSGDHVTTVSELSARYRTQVLTKQGVVDGSVPGGAGLMEKSNASCRVSALKRHETRDTLVVRLYNLTSEPVEETLRFGTNVTSAWRTSLLEERLSEMTLSDARALVFELGPHEIATMEVEFARQA